MSKGLFVVGTGTDVGKTYITALLVKALKRNGKSAAYYKAAMSGNSRDNTGKLIAGDAQYVKNISGINQPECEMCPYLYEKAYSPHLAAKIEKNPVSLARVTERFEALKSRYEYITVEGSGGIVCPLRYDGEELYLTDVIRVLKLSCVLVADAGLGAINSVVLTADYMRARGFKLNGIIMNRFIKGDPICEDNAVMCEKLTGVKVVARIRNGACEFPVSPEFLYE